MEDTMELGGNIELTGFKDIDRGKMVVVKKMVGNYAKKLSEKCENFEKLKVTVKGVHETEANKKYEIHAMLIDNGKTFNSEVVERNLFMGLDSVLSKIENEMAS